MKKSKIFENVDAQAKKATYFIERHSVWCPGIKMDSVNGNVQTEGFQGFSYTGRRNYRT